MQELLQFPQEYEIHTKLTVEKYLEKANLTPKVRAFLKEHLIDIQIPYCIRFADKSEVHVYHVQVKNNQTIYDEKSVVRNIAQATPYDCMIVWQCARAVRFYLFLCHPNSRNSGRSVVDETYKSRTVALNGNSSGLSERLLHGLQDQVRWASNSDELILGWKTVLEEIREQGQQQHLEKLRELGYLEYDPFTDREYLIRPAETALCYNLEDRDNPMHDPWAISTDEWDDVVREYVRW